MNYKSLPIEIRPLKHKEFAVHLDEFAELRIHVFGEWPYLYEGSIEDEREYLQSYANSENAILILALCQSKVIGGIGGLPLTDALKETKTPFIKTHRPLEKIFYLGEIILLRKYRGRGIGLRLYQQFEKLVLEKNRYDAITFCEIERSGVDHRKPASYQSLEPFWQRLGFQKSSNLSASYAYQEIGTDEKSPHPMLFWEKFF